MNIDKMNEQELINLKKKIQSREQEIRNIQKENERHHAKKILDALMDSDILPYIRHERTSCSDENPINGYYESDGYAKCTKCHLLDVIEDHRHGNHDFQVVVRAELYRI